MALNIFRSFVLVIFFFGVNSSAFGDDFKDGVYLYNLSGKKDPVPYLRKEAQKGDSIAQRILAYKLSYMGSMTSESLKWYLASARQGELYSMLALGRVGACKMAKECAPNGDDWFDYFVDKAKSRASNNDSKAMRALSYYYGIIDNDDKEFYWLEKSAKAGYARAQYDLARKINKGEGFYWTESGRRKDVRAWYQKSSSQGFYPAKMNLSDMLFNEGEFEKGKELLYGSLYDGYESAFKKVYLCKSGMRLRDRSSYCGDIKKDKVEAWGLMLYMNYYGVYVDEASEYEDSFTYEERKESEKYYQELKSKIPRLFGQRVVY